MLIEGIENIPWGLFEDCSSLSDITLPSSTRTISDWAFSGCTSLQKVLLNDGLQSIGIHVFDSCTSLDSISVPSTVKKIGRYVFRKCINLREVVLNEGIEYIARGLFEDCSSLSDITLPSSTRTIACWAFSGCTSLPRIAFPSSVTDVGSYVLDGCNNLREVALHGAITQQIASNAFYGPRLLYVLQFPTISSRFNALSCHWSELNNKLDEIRGVVERRDGDLCAPSSSLEWRDGEWDEGWDNIRTIFNKIEMLISHYEVKEAQTIVELAFWKSQLDQAVCTATNRNEYRVGIPGLVQDTIMMYYEGCIFLSALLS